MSGDTLTCPQCAAVWREDGGWIFPPSPERKILKEAAEEGRLDLFADLIKKVSLLERTVGTVSRRLVDMENRERGLVVPVNQSPIEKARSERAAAVRDLAPVLLPVLKNARRDLVAFANNRVLQGLSESTRAALPQPKIERHCSDQDLDDAISLLESEK